MEKTTQKQMTVHHNHTNESLPTLSYKLFQQCSKNKGQLFLCLFFWNTFSKAFNDCLNWGGGEFALFWMKIFQMALIFKSFSSPRKNFKSTHTKKNTNKIYSWQSIVNHSVESECQSLKSDL